MQTAFRAESATHRKQPRKGLAARLGEAPGLVAGKVRQRIAVWQQRRAMVRELRAMGDRELAELGLTRNQIALFAEQYPGASSRLGRMVARLGLRRQEAALSHLVRNDLYRTCVMCTVQRKCDHWLDATDVDTAHAPNFCPNARTFEVLIQSRRRESGEAGQTAPRP